MKVRVISRRARIAAVTAVFALTMLIELFPAASTASASSSTLTSVADGYTKSDAPTEVNTNNTPFRIDGSPTWNAYVQFDVPAGTVQSAVLRLTAASSTGSATGIKSSGSSWDEATLNYNNAPTPGSTIGSISSITSGQSYDVDVSSAVAGDSTVSFAITSTSGTARTFNSRESSTGKPELIVTYADNSQDTVHTMSQVHEDAINGSQSTKMRFEGEHGGTAEDPYMFDLTVKHVSGDSEGMNLVFREQDDVNFYQLDLEQYQVLLREKVDPDGESGSEPAVMTTRATGCDGWVTDNNSYRVKMLLKGATFEVYEHEETTPCATWTDPDAADPTGESGENDSYFASGHNASYYCMPGNYCIWEKVEARPLSVTASPLAWNFTGQNPGYYSSQTISENLQSILESRFAYTVQNYKFGPSYNNGTSDKLDHVEHGADGNVEYHLDEWSDFGTRIVYRATVGQYGYHVRFDNGSTVLKRKNTDNSWTTLATASSSVPLNRHVKVVVDGDRHRLIDETDCNPTCTTYWDVTDSTYDKGNKTYWGNVTVDGATLRGSFRALP